MNKRLPRDEAFPERLPGESEVDRLRRMVALTKKWVPDGHPWPAEHERMKALLQIWEHPGHEVIGNGSTHRFTLRCDGTTFWVATYYEDPEVGEDPVEDEERFAEVTYERCRFFLRCRAGEFEGWTPQEAAREAWVAISIAANDVPATVNENGVAQSVWSWSG